MSADDDLEQTPGPDSGATRHGRRHAADAPTPDEPAGVTRVGRRDRAAPAPEVAADPGATRTGRRRSGVGADAPVTSARPGGPLRFGPGVPAAGAPTPGWAAAPRRRRRGWVGGLVGVGIVTGILAYLLLQPQDPVAITGITVAAQNAPGTCDVTVDVVATVATNGRAGTFVYQWQRSDGQAIAPQTRSVASGETSVTVVLQWSVSGRGSLDARASLRVLDPATVPPTEGAGGFTYSCP